MPSILRTGFRQWNNEVNSVWGVTTSIATVMCWLDLARPDILPDLRSGPTLLLTSDYGGQHKTANHATFSFLLADLVYCDIWNATRTRVRSQLLKDHRRMCYKAMN